MISPPLPTLAEMTRLSAGILLETKSVHFNAKDPFILSSGLPSPTYVDCRRLISFPSARKTLLDFIASKILSNIGLEAFDNVAGGETAGIPFAALLAERFNLPMSYIRKKPKGYGRNARIEGVIEKDQRVLLVEDMATDGSSKLSFVEAIRQAGATCNHVAMIFFYDIFKDAAPILEKAEIQLHYLCTWWDVLAEAKSRKAFDSATLDAVEAFLNAPRGWQDANITK